MELEQLEQAELLLQETALTNDLLRGIASVLIFFVIVVLCHYGYKFLKLFF